MNYEVMRGCRTKFRGAEEDWSPTKRFVETWHAKNGWPKCFVLLRDVNYAVDGKIDGKWRAHYEVSTIFGIAQYQNAGGGLVFTREDPDPWMSRMCAVVDMTLPYDWVNPELGAIEPGYIQVRLAAPLESGSLHETTAKLVQMAQKLEYGYGRMLDTEYPDSRYDTTARNDWAEFTVRVSITDSLTDEAALD